MQYLIESGDISKSGKKFKCPYCDTRKTRMELIDHIDSEHSDMIPQDFTATRIVFNIINKKTNGTCTECGKESPWNEENKRYDRFCCKKCRDNYIKTAKNRMITKHGVEHMLNNEEHQKLMLSNRRISGEYKFTDGGIRSYCGSYERKLLEFYDKILHVHSDDIETPGPVIEYEFEGETHKWITDLYYIPFNLVHDVKDGGSNPNNRQMDEYRAKQVAKEKAIAKINKYNYIRLTDNDFKQLISILMDMKDSLINQVDDFIIRINEDVKNYIVPIKNDLGYIEEFGYTTNTRCNPLYTINKESGCIDKQSFEFLEGKSFELYRYDDECTINLENKIDNYNPFYIYESMTNKKYLDSDQIIFDKDFTKVIDDYSRTSIRQNIIESSLINVVAEMNNDISILPITNKQDIIIKTNIQNIFENINIFESLDRDSKKYILCNNINNKSYTVESIESLDTDLLSVLNEL